MVGTLFYPTQIDETALKAVIDSEYSTQIAKLAGVSSGADVTATAIGPAILAAPNKPTPSDTDQIPIYDNSGGAFKSITWATVKSVLTTLFNTLYLPLSGGSLSGILNMNSHKITGLSNGTAATDAAAYGQLTASAITYKTSGTVSSSMGTSEAVTHNLGVEVNLVSIIVRSSSDGATVTNCRVIPNNTTTFYITVAPSGTSFNWVAMRV